MESYELPSENQFLRVKQHEDQWTFATSDAGLLDLTAALLEPYGELIEAQPVMHQAKYTPSMTSSRLDAEHEALLHEFIAELALTVEPSADEEYWIISSDSLENITVAMSRLYDRGRVEYSLVESHGDSPSEGSFLFKQNANFNPRDEAFLAYRKEYLEHYTRYIDSAAQLLPQESRDELIKLRIALWGSCAQSATIEQFIEIVTKAQEILPYVQRAQEVMSNRPAEVADTGLDDGQPTIEHTKPTMWARWFGDSGNGTDVDKENQNNNQPG